MCAAFVILILGVFPNLLIPGEQEGGARRFATQPSSVEKEPRHARHRTRVADMRSLLIAARSCCASADKTSANRTVSFPILL